MTSRTMHRVIIRCEAAGADAAKDVILKALDEALRKMSVELVLLT